MMIVEIIIITDGKIILLGAKFFSVINLQNNYIINPSVEVEGYSNQFVSVCEFMPNLCNCKILKLLEHFLQQKT